MRKPGQLFLDLTVAASEQRYAKITLQDGCSRTGRITGIVSRKVRVDGKEERFVTDVEFNGETHNTLQLYNLRSIEFVE